MSCNWSSDTEWLASTVDCYLVTKAQERIGVLHERHGALAAYVVPRPHWPG